MNQCSKKTSPSKGGPDIRRHPLTMAVAMALVGIGHGASAATFTVERLADDTDPGSLRWAVQSANSSTDASNTIEFSSGLNGTIALGSPLTISSNSLTISGPGPDQITVEQDGLVFQIEGSAAAVAFTGLTLRHPVGATGINERIVTSRTLDLTLDDVIVASNGFSSLTDGRGGCLLNDQSANTSAQRSLTIRNSVFDRCETRSSGSYPQTHHGGALYSEQLAAYGLSSTVLIEDSTFNNGFAYGNGGAVALRQGALGNFDTSQSITITGSEFKDNIAYGGGAGGALWFEQVDDSSVVIEDTLFDNSRAASYGGAIDGRQGTDSSLLMSEVTASDNFAPDSGAVRFYSDQGSTINIEDSLFDGNRTFNGSNALRLDLRQNNMSLDIARTTLSNNTGGFAGVLFTQMLSGQNRRVSIVDSTISGNEADRILTITSTSTLNESDQVEIINTTITGNTVEGSVGVDIAGSSSNPEVTLLHTTIADNLIDGGPFEPSVVRLPNALSLVRNSIISNQFASGPGPEDSGESGPTGIFLGFDLSGVGVNLRHSLVGQPGLGLNDLGGNINFQDPGLDALADNGGPTRTMAISESSVVFDAGDPLLADLPSFDQRGEGFNRNSGARPDMGAYELQLAPELGLSADDLNFPDTRVGSSAEALGLTISNTGNADLEIDQVSVFQPMGVGSPFSISSETCTAAPVPAGEQCAVSVVFTPDDRADFSAALQINSNAPSSPDSAGLSGTGIAPLIALGDDLDFGSVDVGETAGPSIVTLTNPGDDALEVTGFDGISAPFSLDFSDCGPDLPFTLAIDGSCDLALTFAPTAAEPFDQDVTVQSDAFAGDPVFNVVGAGVEPGVAVSPLAFPELRVGQSQNESVTVTNSGSGTLDIDNIALSDNAGGVFGLISEDCTNAQLPSNETCQVTISFNPDDRANFTGALQIDSNATSSPTMASLSGTGIAPVIDLGQDIDFDEVEVGQTAGPESVLLSNIGDDVLEVSGLTGDSAPFALGFSNCAASLPFNLAAGDSCQLTATFQPDEEGPAAQTISVGSDAFAGPTEFGLSGEGVTAELQVSPLSIVFSDNDPGTATSQNVTISNAGRAALQIESIGSLADPFQLEPDTCPATLPFTLENQGDSCTLTVGMELTEPGEFNEDFTVVSTNGGSATVTVQALSGTGPSPSPDPIPVPTLSRVATLATTVMLALFGWLGLRRRQAGQAR